MTIPNTRDLSALSLLLAGIFAVSPATVKAQSGAVDSGSSKTITGQAAFADFSQQRPGVRRKITVADLPAPNEAESVDNGPTVVPRPEGAWPIAPAATRCSEAPTENPCAGSRKPPSRRAMSGCRPRGERP